MTELQEIREDVRETRKEVAEIKQMVNDLKVLVVGNYVTKEEFEKHEKDFDDYKKNQVQSLRWGLGFVFVVGGLIWSIVSWLVDLLNRNGKGVT
uniref:Uncharacterized protein n=1 Tax=Ammonifex degensii TaxID=42838 RepID=A0A7C1J7M8_9THEO